MRAAIESIKYHEVKLPRFISIWVGLRLTLEYSCSCESNLIHSYNEYQWEQGQNTSCQKGAPQQMVNMYLGWVVGCKRHTWGKWVVIGTGFSGATRTLTRNTLTR